MKLSNVLGRIQGNDGEKTASAVSTPAAPSTEKAASDTGARLKAALHEVTNPVAAPAEKKASNTPIADLTKLAADTASAEHEALVKEAQLYGAAVADGFMARLAQYDAAAEKVAAQLPTPATRVPAHLEKQAADLGYANTMGQLEKLAGAAYTQGFNDTVAQIYKVAHSSFVDGYKHACELITAAR